MGSITAETRESFTKLELFQIIQQLQAQIAELEEKLAARSKNSSTSSKPPSSDIVKPPKPKSSGPGAPGGQKGHPGFFRKLFPMERLDEIKEYRLSQCPVLTARPLFPRNMKPTLGCGGRLCLDHFWEKLRDKIVVVLSFFFWFFFSFFVHSWPFAGFSGVKGLPILKLLREIKPSEGGAEFPFDPCAEAIKTKLLNLLLLNKLLS